jgi:uncharacterized protein (TIGR03032 family)
VLIDVESNLILTKGLSMPHSPRWYDGRLWVLESGTGSLGVVDKTTGHFERVCSLPGFTRGLDFAGNLAFVGLSQVRESAVFGGLPITETLAPEDRNCGVWVVDIRTGETVAFLKFEEAVQEIFSVTVLRNLTFPEIYREPQEVTGGAFVLPDHALGDVPSEFVTRSVPNPGFEP